MKKIYLTLGFGALLVGANAQQQFKTVLTPVKSSPVTSIIGVVVSSTLTPASLNPGACGSQQGGIVYYITTQHTATPQYTVDAEGFVFGTNEAVLTQPGLGTYTLSGNQVAQKYNVTGNVTVSGLIVISAISASDAGTTLIKAKIFSEDAITKKPSAQIGVTGTKALNTFTGNDYITFSTPVSVSAGKFFAVIESPKVGGATHDSLAILSTAFGCSSTDSLSWSNTLYNGTTQLGWKSVINANGGTPNDNLDVLIFPVTDLATGVNNTISKGSLTLSAAYPNPSVNEVSVNFGLNQASKVEIELYDVTGKVVSTIKLDELQAGEHSSKINVSTLNAGVYLYSVKSNNAKLFSKFTIAK